MKWIGKFKTTKIGGWCSKFEVTGGRRHCVKITAWCYFLFVLLKGMAKRQWQLVIAFWPKLSTAFSRIEWSKSWLTQEEARKAKNVVCRCVLCAVLIWCYTYVSICYLSLTSNAAATLSFSASRRTKFKSKSEKQQKQKVANLRMNDENTKN